MKTPTIQEIDGSLESMQRIVGGDIEAVYPFDDPVALVCHGEGKLLGLPMNRTLTDDHEKYKDKYSNEMILSVPKQPEAHKKPMKKEKHEYER